jgi:hypothetical protein
MSTTIAAAADKLLTGTTGALTARTYELGKDDAIPDAEWPYSQIIEHLDKRLCALCRAVHGKIVVKGTPEHARWRLPSHINCRRILVDLHRDQRDADGKPPQPDLREPPDGVSQDAWDKLVKQHGHFLNDPKKYEALRCPARPTGRDFIYRAPAPGRKGELVFARALPDGLLRETLKAIASPIVTEALAQGAGEVAAVNANVLKQCAQQSANRQWWDHYPHEVGEHAGDWGVRNQLSEQLYRTLPTEVLQADPDVALSEYHSLKYGWRKSVVFRAHNLKLGHARLDEAWVQWDTHSGDLFHVGKLDLGIYQGEHADWVTLTGDW